MSKVEQALQQVNQYLDSLASQNFTTEEIQSNRYNVQSALAKGALRLIKTNNIDASISEENPSIILVDDQEINPAQLFIDKIREKIEALGETYIIMNEMIDEYINGKMTYEKFKEAMAYYSAAEMKEEERENFVANEIQNPKTDEEERARVNKHLQRIREEKIVGQCCRWLAEVLVGRLIQKGYEAKRDSDHINEYWAIVKINGKWQKLHPWRTMLTREGMREKA